MSKFRVMGKDNSKFMFKHFSVSHNRSSMKVGVDGVLLGSWVDAEGAQKILDVGTGCGLIALMIAQRYSDAKVVGIDIDEASVEEAMENVLNSSWSERISILHGSFPEALSNEEESGYDLIVSNPPYFDSGVACMLTSRERARHQGSLSPSSLLSSSVRLLRRGGSVAMVVPSEFSLQLEEEASGLGYQLYKKCLVRGHSNAPYKRVLLQWKLSEMQEESEKIAADHITLEADRGCPTEDYRLLCKDFYIKF